jgi:hypothetical protein
MRPKQRGKNPPYFAFPPEFITLAAFSWTYGETMKNAFESSGSSPTDSESRLQTPPDVLVENHGSIFLLRPVSPIGQAWLQDNVTGEETQLLGNAVVCEPRYVADIVFGARGEGLVVRA